LPGIPTKTASGCRSEWVLTGIWGLAHNVETMPKKLTDLMHQIEAEAREEGGEAVAELAALRAHYSLARELHDLRLARGLTQQQLAEKSGVGQSEISRIESGAANPTVATVSALAAPLNADLHLTPHSNTLT
jgi:DNA-binding XRE family transcriptional regulator